MFNELQVVARARSMIGKGCHYKLGAGGFNPEFAAPWIVHPFCDCTGFEAWSLGMPRRTDHPRYKPYFGEWIESTAMLRDAKEPRFGLFDEVAWRAARPGMVLVYGDHVDRSGTRRQGHVGIVCTVGRDGPLTAVHCSAGNERRTGDAIRETDCGAWLANGIVAACSEVERWHIPMAVPAGAA